MPAPGDIGLYSLFVAASHHTIAHGGTTLRQAAVAGFTLAEVAYPPDLRVPVHTHDHAHVGFLLGGSCRETVGRRVYDYEPMNLVVKGSGESHSNRAGRRGTRFLIADVGDEARVPGVLHERAQLRGGRLAPIAVRLREELHIRDGASQLAMEGLLLELFAEIRRRKAARPHRGAPPWVERARELLHDRVAEAGTLRHLAAELGIHPAHFARAFRTHVGVTPGGYLRGLRLEKAMRLLAETDRPLAEVARQAGYCDQSHLTRALRGETGCTPAVYRRRLRD